MQWFREFSIKRKQMFVMMLTSIVALLLACVAFFTYDIVSFRKDAVQDLTTLAEFIADRSSLAGAPNVRSDAGETLNALALNKSISTAAIYQQNQPFALYQRGKKKPAFTPPVPKPDGAYFEPSGILPDRLTLFRTIRSNGTSVGTVYLESDLDEWHERLNQKATIALLVLLGASAVAWLLSFVLQRVISRPIQNLAQIVGVVSKEKNYSVRAVRHGGDELGVLIDGFNGMLQQIQERDTALQRAHDDLERRVRDRTTELRTEFLERKRTEAALKESEIRFRTLVQSANDAIILADATGNIISWNAGARRLFDYSSEEAMGKPITLLMPERLRSAHLDGLARLRATGSSRVIGRTIELTGLRKNGDEFPIDLSLSTWQVDGGTFFSGIIRDISERKRAEGAVQKQLSRISLLNHITHAISERQDLESILDVVLYQLEEHLPVDFGGVFLYNSDTKKLTAAARRIKGGEFLPRLDQVLPFGISDLEACRRGESIYVSDTKLRRGAHIEFLSELEQRSIMFVPLMVEHKLFGILITGRRQPNGFDSAEGEFLHTLSEHVALAGHQAKLYTELQTAYNDLRQTQQTVMQQERLSALGQMASGIAHDVNNALSPILVYSELFLLSHPNLKGEERKQLEYIATASQDIAHIVSRMREFYRRRDGADPVQPLELNQLAKQVIEMTRPRWRDIPQERGIMVEMTTDFEPTLPPVVGLDVEIREALTNLILNAVDAMPNGGKLSLRTKLAFIGHPKDSRDPTHISVELTDTGIGMDEETKKRCLEPFFSTKGQRGTGLGLAMVYGVMERHGGTIEIETAVGKGTTVRLLFPLRTVPAAHLADALPIPPPDGLFKILCIDDEPLMRTLLKDLLETHGYRVDTADDGRAGLDVFRVAQQSDDPFDAIVTDLGMPHLDGRQVARTIKRESPATAVIMLTGWGTMIQADGSPEANIDAILSKPPKMKELLLTLAKVTASSAKMQQPAI